MGCVVFWQISSYIVLGVLYSMWWCLVSVDAHRDDEQQFKPNFYSATPSSPTFIPHNNADNETRPGRAATTMTGSKDEDSLEEQLKDDQVALKRMVTILSLVGFIGALAVIGTIVIFTKMRRRKQRINSKMDNTIDNDDDDDDDELSTNQQTTTTITAPPRRRDSNDINNNHYSLDSARNRSIEHETPPQNDVSIINMAINPTTTNISKQLPLPYADAMKDPQPSAPPTSTFADHHQPTLSISLLQQPSASSSSSIPTPSAPTAKELDQRELDNATDLHHQQGQHCHSAPSSPSVNITMIATTPDLPPPAYTPSPLYDRTYQTAITTTAATQLAPSRRHSQI